MQYSVEDNCKVYLLRLPREREKVPITFEIAVFKHLTDGITDWPSLEFALEAKHNLKSFCNILEGIKKELEKSTIDLISILKYIWLRTLPEKSGNITSTVDKLLSPWHLFVIIQRLFQNNGDQNNNRVCEMLQSDLKEHYFRHPSKLQLIFLLPCINYLSLFVEDNPLASGFPSKFEEEMDLNIRKVKIDATAQLSNSYAHLQRHHAEAYVIKLLQHYTDQSRLCQSILDFLFAQNEEIWKNICQLDNGDKCWRVMCTAFRNDFSMWNKFIEQLQSIHIFEDDKVRIIFFENFNGDNTFQHLVTSKVKKNNKYKKKNSWKSDDDLLTTIEQYIDKIFYSKEILSCLIDILWNVR
ncbi:hypothetical protein RFI_33015 [Reticulomyxa filosa]|uniref:Uncharacterized protein n=1 Tax=Reticulomyxa filosa TaxID=46433 RepID=X6LTH2_RETFI|nr:hypothetical protein RFI_33015 [Reticulomyxa filosa]|eukprot:ETO04382.1 hypothetical protein RFI_33015 [Reticulomyxa filosa]